MNTTEDPIFYRANSKTLSSPSKKAPYFEYDISTDKRAKKDKKWSFGNLFRRKNKVVYSSSDDETKISGDKKGEKGNDKPKAATTRKPKDISVASYFTNISIPSENITPKSVTCYSALASDNEPHQIHSNFYDSNNKNKLTIVDSINKRSRKESAKVRAEARRNSLNINSSSDDENSQHSNSSYKPRSNEGMNKVKEPFSRKSKAARTERYLKRHSRDGENPNNYLRVSKSDVETTFLRVSDDNIRSESTSPLDGEFAYTSISSQSPSFIGHSTIPLTNTIINNNNSIKGNSLTTNPSYKSPLFLTENNTPKVKVLKLSNNVLNRQRSISYDAIINEAQERPQMIHAKLELGIPQSNNLTVIDDSHTKQYHNFYHPPLPPPRDPKRLHGQYFETINQKSDNCNSKSYKSYGNHSTSKLDVEMGNLSNLNFHSGLKTSSEYNIPLNYTINQVPRPSSAGLDYNNKLNTVKFQNTLNSDNYRYLTDKQSRSRKPICIQNCTESRKLPNCNVQDRNTQLLVNKTKLEPQIFLPSVVPASSAKNDNVPNISNQNAVSPVKSEDNYQHKSTNLEDALNELEAIYNSLKLGDENLLEMAEKREQEIVNQNILANRNKYTSCANGRATLSDSGFNYEAIDCDNPGRRKKYSHRSLKSDHLAFRTINKDERSPANDPQCYVSEVRCFSTLPVYSSYQSYLQNEMKQNEPDIALDDVVYRNIKQLNKMKVPEHPPPFGIPLGPITVTTNSDYLHAIPDSEQTKCRRTPDLVKDDLAYRNLRKDNNKEPVLPQISPDDVRNNNLLSNSSLACYSPRSSLSVPKKRRAIRSKSENISNLIRQEVIERAARRNARDTNTEIEYDTLTNIANAMHLARQVLKEKEKVHIQNKLASMSDTDSSNFQYVRYPPINGSSFDRKERNDSISGNCLNSMNLVNHTCMPPNNTSPKGDSFLDRLPYKNKVQSEQVFPNLSESELNNSSNFEIGQTANNEHLLIPKNDERIEKLNMNNFYKSDSKLSDCYSGSNHYIVADNIIQVNQKDAFSMPSSSTQNSNIDDATRSDHDYENISSDVEQTTYQKQKSENESSFDGEFNKVLASLLNMNDSVKNEKIEHDNDEEHDYCNLDSPNQIKKSFPKIPGENCINYAGDAFHRISECACSKDKITSLVCSRENNTINSRKLFQEHLPDNASKLTMNSSLTSPKLVLETSRINQSPTKNLNNTLLQKGETYNNKKENNSTEMRHIPDHPKSATDWYNDPATLTIACSYGIACFHQLAALDLFALMSIIFAVLTFITALLI